MSQSKAGVAQRLSSPCEEAFAKFNQSFSRGENPVILGGCSESDLAFAGFHPDCFQASNPNPSSQKSPTFICSQFWILTAHGVEIQAVPDPVKPENPKSFSRIEDEGSPWIMSIGR